MRLAFDGTLCHLNVEPWRVVTAEEGLDLSLELFSRVLTLSWMLLLSNRLVVVRMTKTQEPAVYHPEHHHFYRRNAHLFKRLGRVSTYDSPLMRPVHGLHAGLVLSLLVLTARYGGGFLRPRCCSKKIFAIRRPPAHWHGACMLSCTR